MKLLKHPAIEVVKSDVGGPKKNRKLGFPDQFAGQMRILLQMKKQQSGEPASGTSGNQSKPSS